MPPEAREGYPEIPGPSQDPEGGGREETGGGLHGAVPGAAPHSPFLPVRETRAVSLQDITEYISLVQILSFLEIIFLKWPFFQI